MNIQQQNGIVSTVNITPYLETKESQSIRNSIFEQAQRASNSGPTYRIDVFDESILIFESCYQALNFLLSLFRVSNRLNEHTNCEISLKSSLCEGSYFLHQDQVYGDAVNLATSLSCTSRENELRVCGFDRQIINAFVDSHEDIACFVREEEQNCVSIGLLDKDCTVGQVEKKVMQIEHNSQIKMYETSRNRKIEIGRSQTSDVFILGDHISRSHATITLNYDNAFIEDHSANGTFIYIDDREIFLTQEKVPLPDFGTISCGLKSDASINPSNMIEFQIREPTNISALAS